ncbi:hypothetical protein AWZ03_010326 [Drosophila navojoa]|uniref:Uncharacterized protein n=1 Tax=Drosophila navojoa TaxID=7232 RepID=A0A484B3P1_DRONA|nr:hypothetical protein AWZ03_010326 [Drosophila navojoa]
MATTPTTLWRTPSVSDDADDSDSDADDNDSGNDDDDDDDEEDDQCFRGEVQRLAVLAAALVSTAQLVLPTISAGSDSDSGSSGDSGCPMQFFA